jgi:4-hydroxy-tetrahydrodipicolinate synthase
VEVAMPVIDFRGAWTALVTPFDEVGNLDFEGLEKNIEFQISQGISGVLPVGTTGESPTLTESEHGEVVKRTKLLVGERCGVLAGAGSNSTREALHYCEHALASGVDTVLLVDCYYNGPSSIELRENYYKTILDAYKDIRVVIYVIPGRTGTVISSEDIAILSMQYDRVVAIKEATGNIQRMKQERSLMPEMSIMSGDDDKTLEMMTNQKIESAGVISVITNIAPKAVSEMVSSFLTGDREKGERLARILKPLFSIVTVKAKSTRKIGNREMEVEDRFRNPIAIKTAMQALGLPAGPPRLPLGRMTAPGVKTVRSALQTVFSESPEVFSPLEDFYAIDVESRLGNDAIWDRLTYQGVSA